MDLGIDGKVALVTGATAGIGRATATMLAAEGARLAILGRRSDELDKLADEIGATGRQRPLTLAADLVQLEVPGRIREQVEQAFGGLDILINNAGAAEQPGTVLTEDVWQSQFELNFHQKRRMTEAFEDLLKASPQGRVITLATVLEPSGPSAAMSALGACLVWSKGYARHMGPFGVTVNCVAPGRVESEQLFKLFPDDSSRETFITTSGLPMKRFGCKDEAAGLILYLASAQASYVTGQCIAVDGGLKRAI
ncbi:SDR family NAD(P)-dependent oxidoreductase [Nocardia abscessus]|uniref:SDR family NAD(P)-dependent oxidoreductase n=1 Tax=Nocardia abscessus TaxID=120957 RepID=UPI002458C218|nr:SDR family oxidoreductase [Nocardia abscessus]